MNAMEFYLRSVDAQTWQDCEAEGVDPDAALAELPAPVPEAPSMIVEVAPPAILKPPPAPAVRPPQPPQSPARRHSRQSPASAASSRRHSRVSQSPASDAPADESAPLYEAVTFQPTHQRPTKQPVVRSRPLVRWLEGDGLVERCLLVLCFGGRLGQAAVAPGGRRGGG